LAAGKRALEHAEIVGTPNLIGTAAQFYGEAHALNGEWERATELMRMAVAGGMDILGFFQPAPLARALLRLGQAEDAVSTAEAGITHCREAGADLYECRCQLALAEALTATEAAPARSRIEAAIERAQQLARASGSVEQVPRIHLARAGLAGVLGDRAGQQRELSDARRLFSEMGATGHAELAARDLGSSS
jgi:hypothetical protein